jgi:hypothetical protein
MEGGQTVTELCRGCKANRGEGKRHLVSCVRYWKILNYEFNPLAPEFSFKF